MAIGVRTRLNATARLAVPENRMVGRWKKDWGLTGSATVGAVSEPSITDWGLTDAVLDKSADGEAGVSGSVDAPESSGLKTSPGE